MSGRAGNRPVATNTPDGGNPMSQSYIDALEAEREGYVRRGLTDRVAQVDAELARVRALDDVAAPDEVDEPAGDDDGSDDPDAHGASDDRPRRRRRRSAVDAPETAIEF